MRNNKNMVFGILALLVAVSAITFAYAGFTQTLNVTGQGKVVSSRWDIHFENLSSPTLTKTALVTTAPTITSGTTIGNYAVRLMTPGDSVSYTFDVVNDGDFNATLTTLTKNTPTCSGGNSTNVCNNLTYTLVYTSNNAAVAQNDTLNVGETKTMKLTLTFNNSNSTSVLPTSDITVSNLGITLLYSQSSLFTVAPTPSANYVYTISTTTYNIGGAAPSLSSQIINENNNIIKLAPPAPGGSIIETAVVSTEEEILSIIQTKGYYSFIRHIVEGGIITESYVGFTGDYNTVYYLKGYDTSAYTDNQAVIAAYNSAGGGSAYPRAFDTGYVDAYTGLWSCGVGSNGGSYCNARSGGSAFQPFPSYIFTS